jgi:hypothetical protein
MPEPPHFTLPEFFQSFIGMMGDLIAFQKANRSFIFLDKGQIVVHLLFQGWG